MAETPLSSRLRFLDADDLDDSTVDFSTLDVHGSDDSTLGDLDGFLIDTESGRVVYAVVDSGGWFRSRHLAVPIGHAQLDTGRRRLNVNVTRNAAQKFPGFNPKKLPRFTDGETQPESWREEYQRPDLYQDLDEWDGRERRRRERSAMAAGTSIR